MLSREGSFATSGGGTGSTEKEAVLHLTKDQRLKKRLLDLIVCICLLPLVCLIGVAIALAVRLESSGPILFVQERIGLKGRPFSILKFRTITCDYFPDRNAEFMTRFVRGKVLTPSSPRGRTLFKPDIEGHITRMGRFLRRSGLDELPQFWNVLKGEMSLVGPRPNLPLEVEAYLPWHGERLQVPPGITGLAQINGRSNLTFDQIVRYDLEYIRGWSLGLDVKILLNTISYTVRGVGAG
jgi:lipopolysaccharide/colanic/teichoic acid biosynthesis glycosyltransferase